jgi:glycerol-3-phosphate acyltransferase PlsY
MPDPISWSFAGPYLGAAFLGGYLLGSLPFGMILARLFGLGDLRSVGSGNIGATNVLRTGRKDLAAATLLLDAGKGAVAVLIARELGGPDTALMAGLGAVLGHLFPVWLKFRGGKGVATTFGVIWALAWPVGLAACLTWLAIAALLRYSSLSALVSTASAPIYAWIFMADLQLVQMTLILAVLVWLRHHANIRRLFKGEEPRIDRNKG